MENLRVEFGAGTIRGSGSDIVGPFVLSGVIGESGVVVLRKQYIGQHHVEYTGTFDGEGMLSGQWSIDGLHGPWAIVIRRLASAGLADIAEFVPEL